MGAKPNDKEIVINLRKLGHSYSEILKHVKVSKSSLSLWLRHIHLTSPQIERLRSKNNKARSFGSIALKNQRIEKTKKIINASKAEIGKLDMSDLKIIGSVLYWAEGSKQKEHDPSKELVFSNSDPKMLKIYLLWLQKCLLISRNDILFEIYIHETYNKTRHDLVSYWSEITNFESDKFTKIYYKKNKVNTFRKNRGKNYHGVLRISVKRSIDINRKVTGWILGICEEFNI